MYYRTYFYRDEVCMDLYDVWKIPFFFSFEFLPGWNQSIFLENGIMDGEFSLRPIGKFPIGPGEDFHEFETLLVSPSDRD